MRAFILCALLAMATTVSSQSLCLNQTSAIDTNTTIKALEPKATGCTDLLDNLDDTTICPPTTDGLTYTCLCTSVYTAENKTAYDSAVSSVSGRTCSLDYGFTLTGTTIVANVSKTVSYTASHVAAAIVALGSACNETDIKAKFAPYVKNLTATLVNATASVGLTNVTWTSATFTVSACGATSTGSQSYVPASTTTSPPTNPAGGNATTATPTTGAPTTNPASSTGKSGASIIASSFALVASLIAAVTILA